MIKPIYVRPTTTRRARLQRAAYAIASDVAMGAAMICGIHYFITT